MEGLENIIKEINEKAEKESKKILEDARKKAEDKKTVAQGKANVEKERIMKKWKREVDRMKRRTLANARIRARQKKLIAQEEIIQKVFSNVERELAKLRNNREKYGKIIEDLVKEGGIIVGGGNLEVSVLRGDKKLLSKERVKKLEKEIIKATDMETTLNVIANLKNSSGGVTVQKADGSVKCDNTFETRLKRRRDSLRPKVAEILFKT